MSTKMTIDGIELEIQPGTKSIVRKIWNAADEGGTIQASEMLDFSDDPRHHTTTSIESALRLVGAKIIG